MHDPTLTRDLVAALPKSDLHVHLDGSLRLETLIELAKERNVKLPSRSPSGLKRLVFKQAYENLPEYLKGFEYTVACLSDPEALERAAFELAEDAAAENCCYLEVRFAPQLHVRPGFELGAVMRAVAKGLQRAERGVNGRASVKKGQVPPLRCGVIVCAMRFFNEHFSEHYASYFRALPLTGDDEIFALASQELAKAAVLAREEGLPVVGFDLAGQERGYPAESHAKAYHIAHQGFLGKTVHAGEDYGPESIFQAITECNADRIGHGTWLFSTARSIQDAVDRRQETLRRRTSCASSVIAAITIEVCLTSNQQTIPELREEPSSNIPYAQDASRRGCRRRSAPTTGSCPTRRSPTRVCQGRRDVFKLSAKRAARSSSSMASSAASSLGPTWRSVPTCVRSSTASKR